MLSLHLRMGRVRRRRRTEAYRRWADVDYTFTRTRRCLYSPRCPCERLYEGPYCRWHSRGYRVRPSTVEGAGNGVFTKYRIPRTSLVGEYCGELVTTRDLRRRSRHSDYVFCTEYPDVYIDAARVDSGIERWINDAGVAERQNVEAEAVGARVFLIAKRDIQPGEELFLAYGPHYWIDKTKLKQAPQT